LIAMGYLGRYDNLKTNELASNINQTLQKNKNLVSIDIDQESIRSFEETISMMKKHDVKIKLVMMPLYIHKLNTFKETDYENVVRYFEEYSESSDYVEFINLNLDSLIYDSKNFSDPLHFNVYGQRLISQIISTEINDEFRDGP